MVLPVVPQLQPLSLSNVQQKMTYIYIDVWNSNLHSFVLSSWHLSCSFNVSNTGSIPYPSLISCTKNISFLFKSEMYLTSLSIQIVPSWSLSPHLLYPSPSQNDGQMLTMSLRFIALSIDHNITQSKKRVGPFLRFATKIKFTNQYRK